MDSDLDRAQRRFERRGLFLRRRNRASGWGPLTLLVVACGVLTLIGWLVWVFVMQ
jgi:hypothetical protein